MSVVSVTSFLIDYPEFKEQDRLFIERKLIKAESMTPYNVWGNDQREGIMLLAAHLISISPVGQDARIEVKDDGKTTYGNEREFMERAVSMGMSRVT